MRHNQNLLSGKHKYLYGLIALFFTFVICMAFSTKGNDDFDLSRKEILLRRIGHELLLQSGDSTSRVLPVRKIADNEYQITFENQFTFRPGSLVNTTRRLLSKDPLTADYVVNVMKRGNNETTFGYAISGNKKDDILACLGRKQPTAYYIINIKFKPTEINMAKKGYLLGSLPFLAFVGFIFLRSAKPRRALPESQSAKTFQLASILFDPNARQLVTNKDTVELTGTEARLLLIFASSPDETIARSRLQKEIWEDEGVIVGRSLDMFISKLRKKLELDPGIRIIVVRGKGYKLETHH